MRTPCGPGAKRVPGLRSPDCCCSARSSTRHTCSHLLLELSLNLLTRAKEFFQNRNLIISLCAFIHATSSAWNTLPPPAALSGKCLPCFHFQLGGPFAVKTSLPCLAEPLLRSPPCCASICLRPACEARASPSSCDVSALCTDWHLNVWGERKEGRSLLSH